MHAASQLLSASTLKHVKDTAVMLMPIPLRHMSLLCMCLPLLRSLTCDGVKAMFKASMPQQANDCMTREEVSLLA